MGEKTGSDFWYWSESNWVGQSKGLLVLSLSPNTILNNSEKMSHQKLLETYANCCYFWKRQVLGTSTWEQHVRQSLPCCGCPRMVSLSRGPSHAVHFFGLASFLHKVNIPITLVAQHHHALNVRTAEVINDYWFLNAAIFNYSAWSVLLKEPHYQSKCQVL